jgi:hypothetical protein
LPGKDFEGAGGRLAQVSGRLGDHVSFVIAAAGSEGEGNGDGGQNGG